MHMNNPQSLDGGVKSMLTDLYNYRDSVMQHSYIDIVFMTYTLYSSYG